MKTEFILAAALGSILPDVLKLIRNKETPANLYLTTPIYYIGILFQIGIGILAVWLVHPISIQHSVAVGYAGPNLLTTFLGNLIQEKPATGGNKGLKSTPITSARKLFAWWRS